MRYLNQNQSFHETPLRNGTLAITHRTGSPGASAAPTELPRLVANSRSFLAQTLICLVTLYMLAGLNQALAQPCTPAPTNIVAWWPAYWMDIQCPAPGQFEFTIDGCVTNMDYILQEAMAVLSCPDRMQWRDVMRVSPAWSPYSFMHAPTNLDTQRIMFFRAREVPKQ